MLFLGALSIFQPFFGALAGSHFGEVPFFWGPPNLKELDRSDFLRGFWDPCGPIQYICRDYVYIFIYIYISIDIYIYNMCRFPHVSRTLRNEVKIPSRIVSVNGKRGSGLDLLTWMQEAECDFVLEMLLYDV